jgi:hypothetical protein
MEEIITSNTSIIDAIKLWDEQRLPLYFVSWLNKDELNQVTTYLKQFECNILDYKVEAQIRQYVDYIFNQRLNCIFTGNYEVNLNSSIDNQGTFDLTILIRPLEEIVNWDYDEDE